MSQKWKAAITARRRQRKCTQGWRQTRVITSAQQPFVCVDGDWVTNFSSNDYLGLAADPRVAESIANNISEWGNGSAASHMVTGHSELHCRLAKRLASWVGAQSALLFSTGYMANLAVNTALFEKRDLLVHDKLNHASLIDGARLSAGKLRRFAHLNVEHARQIILKEDFDRFAIFVDGVFSMDGDCAPLDELATITDRLDGLLIVDDAHGLGVTGKLGAGSLSSFGFKPAGSKLMVGTLGKALGGFGAFVAGDEEYIEELAQSARSYIYTTAMSNAAAIGNLAALDIIESDGEQRIAKLQQNIRQFRRGCEQNNIPISKSETAIQPIVLGNANLALELSSLLFDRGMLVSAIRAPTVMVGTERLRITITAAHTEAQVTALIEALSESLALLELTPKSATA